ncbi:MAG: thermopsin family protease [Conexivisphaera sp.]
MRCPIPCCVAVLVPAIIALLPAGPQVALASVGHAAALPARGFIQDPSGSIILSPHYYLFQPVTVLTGMNVTFSVRSSVPVDVYLMASSQFSAFESTGSVSSVYGAEGTIVDGNVGPLSGGTYYLVIYNDLSSQDASVTYSASTLPVDVYEYYSSLPAPVGIADYGVLNASGALRPYRIVYEGAIGTATIYSLGAYNPSPPSGISPYGASLQLNVVMAVNTTHGDYAYWLQDVLGFLTNNGTMYIVDNIWNMTSSPSSLSNSTVIGSGAVYTSPAGSYYGYETGAFSYSLPLNVKLLITVSRSSYGASASFGYSVDGGPVVWYDNVTVRSPGVTSAHLLVDGYDMTPSGHFYDSELVFGGEGNGEQTNFTQMKSTLFMEYVLPNGSRVSPPALYGFGSNTAETADDLSATLINGYPAVVIGPGNFGPLWYSATVPQFGAAISAHASTVDAGMSIPVSLDSSTSNGVAPYTYYFYLNGTLAYNFTTYSPQYSGTVELPPTAAGHYALKVVVVDAVGDSASSQTIQVYVNPDPTVSASASRGTTDVGVPVYLNSSASGGTPPYTYTWYVDGQPVSSSQGYALDPPSPGTYSAYVVVTDSVGYRVSSQTIQVYVNPDPTVSLMVSTSSNSFLYSNDVATALAQVQGGTPPFTYMWYLDGRWVANTTSPQYTYALTRMGRNALRAAVADSVGYVASSNVVPVNFTYNYLNLGILAAIVAAAAVSTVLALRRRRPGI